MLNYIKLKTDARRITFYGGISQDFIDLYDQPPTEEGFTENFQKQEIDFKYTFDVSGNSITTTFTNVTENKEVFKYSFDITSINFSEQTVYGIDPWSLTEETVKQNQFVNLSELYLQQGTPAKYFKDKYIVKFFVAKSNPTVDDITALVYEPCDPSEHNQYVTDADITGFGKHKISVDGTGINQDSYIKTINTIDEMYPAVQTTSTTAGEIITVTVTTDPEITELFLKPTVGYLPKSVVTLTNGVGTFKVLTTGLDTGDTVSVAIGYKYFDSVTFTKTV